MIDIGDAVRIGDMTDGYGAEHTAIVREIEFVGFDAQTGDVLQIAHIEWPDGERSRVDFSRIVPA